MRLRFDILLKQRSIHELSAGNPVRKTRMQGVSLSDVFTQTTGFMPLARVLSRPKKDSRNVCFSPQSEHLHPHKRILKFNTDS